MPKVIGIVGSYRKGGVVDSIVTEVLAAAEQQGAQTEKIYLVDKDIHFCANCRHCTQDEGQTRGECLQEDEMTEILDRIEAADGLVLGSPVNFFTITAVTKRFMERLVCYAYWPWGAMAPKMRRSKPTRKAVLVTASAMPAIMGRVFTSSPRLLKITAKTLGAKPVGLIYQGFSAGEEEPSLPPRTIKKAARMARRLVPA
jgi:NAD(P)H-dependent FMN reductase